MKIEEGELIPGVALGEFYIGMEKKEVLNHIKGEYTENKLGIGTQIILENALIWFSEQGLLRQIGVREGFRGSYKNSIKIGATLQEIQEKFGEYKEDYDVYYIAGHEGLCFDLADNDINEEWIELEAPIEWIYIYDINYKIEDDLNHYYPC